MTIEGEHDPLTIRVQVKVEKDTDGSFLLTCPQIGCIFVQDESEEATLKHGVDAIDTYIEMSMEHGDPIPPDIVISGPHTLSKKGTAKTRVIPREEIELTRSFDFTDA